MFKRHALSFWLLLLSLVTAFPILAAEADNEILHKTSITLTNLEMPFREHAVKDLLASKEFRTHFRRLNNFERLEMEVLQLEALDELQSWKRYFFTAYITIAHQSIPVAAVVVDKHSLSGIKDNKGFESSEIKVLSSDYKVMW